MKKAPLDLEPIIKALEQEGFEFSDILLALSEDDVLKKFPELQAEQRPSISPLLRLAASAAFEIEQKRRTDSGR